MCRDAAVAEALGHLFLLAGYVGKDDPSAFTVENLCGGLPDSRPRTGDDGDLTLELSGHSAPCFWGGWHHM